MSDFAGRTVLVTGAAGGIGSELCRRFGAAGARIALLDRRDEVDEVVDALAADGIRASAAVADVGDAGEVEVAVDLLRRELGPVDVLVNNAGFSSAPTLEQTTGEAWAEDLNGNLGGAFHCTASVLADMKAAGGGAIVNIASVNGLMALGDPAYSAAKAGLISFTRALALEYGRFGIRANVICPGTVRTPIWVERAERNPAVLAELVKWYPLGRIAEPGDVAAAALFLASSGASAITGVVLPVDCGLTAGNIVMARELTLEDF